MEILIEFMYILIFCFLGKFIQIFFKLPIPGSVLGMILLFLALILKLIEIKKIYRVTNFLLANLALFFVPAGVGIMTKYDVIKGHILALFIIIIITTILAQIIAGLIIQVFNRDNDIKLKQKIEKELEKEIQEVKDSGIS